MKHLTIAILTLMLFACEEKACYEKYQDKGKITGTVYQESFLKNGRIREGFQATFHEPSGIRSTIVHYENNKAEGTSIDFRKNGDIWSISEYKDGKLIGDRVVFYSRYRIKRKEFYVDGELDGEVILYDTLGNIIERKYYESGEPSITQP